MSLKTSIQSTGVAVLAVSALLSARAVQAVEIPATLVADSTQTAPGGKLNYSTFFAPALFQDQIAFGARVSSGASGTIGAYFAGPAASLSRVADISTPIPGGTGNFNSLDFNPSISASGISFSAGGAGQAGIYNNFGGTLNKVADLTTLFPTEASPFSNFSSPTQSVGSLTFFRGAAPGGNNGIFRGFEGQLDKFVRNGDLIPLGTGAFTSINNNFKATAGNIAYIGNGSDSQQGVYNTQGDENIRIADKTTLSPSDNTPFTFFNSVAVSANFVTFRATTSTTTGIYRGSGNALTTIVDTNTIAPGSAAPFSDVLFPASFGSDVVFFGTADDIDGLYLSRGGAISRIFQTGDTIGGRPIESFDFRQEGFNGTDIGVALSFTDGTNAVYRVPVAVIPEPTSLMAMAAVGSALSMRRRGR